MFHGGVWRWCFLVARDAVGVAEPFLGRSRLLEMVGTEHGTINHQNKKLVFSTQMA